MSKRNILVSACIITYNQEKYIKQCIDSVLKQNLDYNLEIVIGDDCSTDSTGQICLEYAQQNPELIRFQTRSKNLGVGKNWSETILACKGDYIALCEGDDFWIDPNKLQKQIDFLETQDNFVMSFHDVKVVDQNSEPIEHYSNSNNNKRSYSSFEMLSGPIMPTASNVVRGDALRKAVKFPEVSKVFNMDTFTHAHLSRFGEAYFHENMTSAAYRVHDGGVWTRARYNFRVQEALKTLLLVYTTIGDLESKKILRRDINRAYWNIFKFHLKKLDFISLFRDAKNFLFFSLNVQ
ncbi:glycosyltransferase [Acidiluteibacter ferrifornacis]|uniref:Glycosyltransferase n=1 Tax=Acidiluteibacter ferrifornacis TaxID=2692424 RepID=A0A6N9NIZ2_9FLAO|nr:glycosyltransferase [Acidiluteibacter ferrifornacis]NBG66648.1 glycosyltransferase [Acidiluteibacter ferrifornacis]